MSDQKCPRCGCALRTEKVRVPVKRVCDDMPVGFTDYEEREEVSDCVRCTGSY